MTVRKCSRVFFKIASIFSFIILAICLIFAIGILFEVSLFEESFKMVYNSLYELTEADLESVKFDFIINCIFSAIVNFYAGRSYLNISKNKNLITSSKRTIIFFIIIQFAFGMVFASIFAFIGLIIYKPKEYPKTKATSTSSNLNEETSNDQLSKEAIEFCSSNINELNKLLAEKKITQEEYDKAFNNLLSVDYYSDDNAN